MGPDGEPNAMELRRVARAVARPVVRPIAGTVAAVAPVLVLASGCGHAEGDVLARARAFYAALGAHDGAAACRLLAPPTREELEKSAGQPCASAIVQEGLGGATGRPDVRVYASMGSVAWAGETAFLARYDDGWHVFAAGCTPDPTSPRDADRYDCDVQGG
jgi:hypothetical protein